MRDNGQSWVSKYHKTGRGSLVEGARITGGFIPLTATPFSTMASSEPITRLSHPIVGVHQLAGGLPYCPTQNVLLGLLVERHAHLMVGADRDFLCNPR